MRAAEFSSSRAQSEIKNSTTEAVKLAGLVEVANSQSVHPNAADQTLVARSVTENVHHTLYQAIQTPHLSLPDMYAPALSGTDRSRQLAYD
jgi:hypothetical protein